MREIHPRYDISGQKFFKLTALHYVGPGAHGARWKFRCDCGKEVTRRASSVRQGMTKSCGCLRQANLRPRKNIGSSKEILSPRGLQPIVRRLVEARIAKKLTQEAVAKLSGWSYGAITNMELGRVSPRLAMVSDIATALGLTLTIGPADE